jgi:hypothetical protein
MIRVVSEPPSRQDWDFVVDVQASPSVQSLLGKPLQMAIDDGQDARPSCRTCRTWAEALGNHLVRVHNADNMEKCFWADCPISGKKARNNHKGK